VLRVALTGGIATGKSHVLEQFRRRGVPCLDADELAHGVTAAGTEATAAIAARFGQTFVDADGAVDRAKLGRLVFRDEAARKDLEAIVHPAVYRAIAAGMRGFERVGEYPFIVVDIPLLFESDHARDFDRVIVTVCTPERQRERLLERGLTDEEVTQRLAAQWPAAQKARQADFVINTDGTFEETAHQVDEVVKKLLNPPFND
jgi:dephospho-CoA kinase